MDIKYEGALIGVIWFFPVTEDYAVLEMHVAVDPAYRGYWWRPHVRKGVWEIFDVSGCQTVCAQRRAHPAAVRLCKSEGGREVGPLILFTKDMYHGRRC